MRPRVLVAAAAAIGLLAGPARAEEPCEYQALDEDEAKPAYVMPKASAVNIRAEGPGSAIVGKLKPGDSAKVVGACGDWLEINAGFRRGWVLDSLVCQEVHFGIGWSVAEFCEFR